MWIVSNSTGETCKIMPEKRKIYEKDYEGINTFFPNLIFFQTLLFHLYLRKNVNNFDTYTQQK